MDVAQIMELVDSPDKLQVSVRWMGLPNSDDTLEPTDRVYEGIPQMMLRLIARKNIPSGMVTKARSILELWRG